MPDSPPPEEEKPDPKEPNKFDQLMRAACSIKSYQLEQQRKKFELLPTFLKAGVYYTQRHEVVRIQDSFELKYFAFEQIRDAANEEYAMGNFDRACNKFEEALNVFRFFEATDATWQDKGIDDDKLREVDWKGTNPEEEVKVRTIKLNMYLNIAACNIKKKCWSEAVSACQEALLLDPTNIKAHYRRARAVALPINAGVPDLRKAVADLDKTVELYKVQGGNYDYVLKEKERVQRLIAINCKREQDTYSKMFNPKTSVTEFIKKTSKGMHALKFKTEEEKEFERELEQIDREVAEMVRVKMGEFSF